MTQRDCTSAAPLPQRLSVWVVSSFASLTSTRALGMCVQISFSSTHFLQAGLLGQEVLAFPLCSPRCQRPLREGAAEEGTAPGPSVGEQL